ncbi:MAG TPA: hypothetical protein VGG48_04945 [Rhizomicrobium sp.]
MEAPIHAGKDVDGDSMMPRIIVIVVGLVIVAVLGVGVVYSGLWAPPATTVAVASTHH